MGAAPQRDELIEVVVRLPRKTIEDTLMSTSASNQGLSELRLGEVKALLSSRRRRADCFKGVPFHDPSWDMILELYAAAAENNDVAVSRLCSLSGGSTTTALRHLEHLEALGYLSRRADPSDRRRIIVSILPRLRSVMEQWLDLRIAASRMGR